MFIAGRFCGLSLASLGVVTGQCALESKKLSDLAESLREKARTAGLLRGALYRIGGNPGAWVTIFTGSGNAKPGRLLLGRSRDHWGTHDTVTLLDPNRPPTPEAALAGKK